MACRSAAPSSLSFSNRSSRRIRTWQACCSSPRPISSCASTRGSCVEWGPSRRPSTTARELALRPPAAVVHVGVAGAHGITPGGLVIGSEAVYSDIAAEILVVDHVAPDEALLAAMREAVPEALVAPDRDERGRRRDLGPWRQPTASRGDGGLRRAPRVCAGRYSGGRDPRDLERARRGRPVALEDRPRARGARRRTPARSPGSLSVASPAMARGAKRAERPVPPPLPPAERTIGQLVAESIRLYGRHFLRALPLGILIAAINQLTVGASRFVVGGVLLATAPVFSAAYAYACSLEARATRALAVVGDCRCRRHPRLRPGGASLPLVRARRGPVARARRPRCAGRDP